MTNGWTDIRNADVVLAMGGNPAENHPVGFRFVMEAKRNRNAKLVCVDPRFNRTAAVADRFVADPRRHRHRVSRRPDPLRADAATAITTSTSALFTNAPFLVERQLRLRRDARRVLGWDDERKAYTDTSSWSYELDERRLRAGRSDAAASALGVPGDEALLRALHAGDGRRTSAAAAPDDFLKAAELITSTYTRGSRRDDHVCARLDASQPLGAADSRRGDAAAAARQHRPARRRAQRAARPRQHPGRHRLRHGVPQPARLHRRSRRPITRRSTRSSTAVTPKPLRPNVDELLVEHRSLRRQPAQGVLRRRRDARERLRLRLPSRGCRRSAAGGYENWSWAYIFDRMYRGEHGRVLQLRHEPGEQRPALAQGDRRAREAEVAGRRRELRAGDGDVLARRHPRARRPEAGGRADRGLPAAGGELRREGRLVRQLGALDSVEVEGGRSAGRGEARSGDHRAASS